MNFFTEPRAATTFLLVGSYQSPVLGGPADTSIFPLKHESRELYKEG
jgi:hypothetical protein